MSPSQELWNLYEILSRVLIPFLIEGNLCLMSQRDHQTYVYENLAEEAMTHLLVNFRFLGKCLFLPFISLKMELLEWAVHNTAPHTIYFTSAM